MCWGRNDDGAAGQSPGGDIDPAADPVFPFLGGPRFVDIEAGARHFCAIDDLRGAHCWGDNSANQLGYVGAGTNSPVSVSLPGLVNSMALGSSHTCALLDNGDVVCWGDNMSDELGHGAGPSLPSAAWDAPANGGGASAIGSGEWRGPSCAASLPCAGGGGRRRRLSRGALYVAIRGRCGSRGDGWGRRETRAHQRAGRGMGVRARAMC